MKSVERIDKFLLIIETLPHFDERWINQRGNENRQNSVTESRKHV